MARFTRFKASRDAMLFGWAILGEDFLEDEPDAGDGEGGGGVGMPMREEFFQRYKPTLRRQQP